MINGFRLQFELELECDIYSCSIEQDEDSYTADVQDLDGRFLFAFKMNDANEISLSSLKLRFEHKINMYNTYIAPLRIEDGDNEWDVTLQDGLDDGDDEVPDSYIKIVETVKEDDGAVRLKLDMDSSTKGYLLIAMKAHIEDLFYEDEILADAMQSIKDHNDDLTADLNNESNEDERNAMFKDILFNDLILTYVKDNFDGGVDGHEVLDLLHILKCDILNCDINLLKKEK